MPRQARQLKDIQVRQLTKPGLHAVGGTPGLLLKVQPSGARSWVLRVWIGKRRRDIGLGGFPEVPLAQARKEAADLRQRIRAGEDPVADKAAQRAQEAARLTFDEAAKRFLADKEQEFKNRKHRQQWHNTLATYASPVIGAFPIDTIETSHVVQVLEPIWQRKTETATRLRARIEAVLSWATTRGYRSGDNPARWRGHLDTVLPRPGRLQRGGKSHPAMPYDEVPAFMATLLERQGTAAQALAFLILTAARSGEVRGARWQEIDWQAATWQIPGERMKGGTPHTVPLSKGALAILQDLPRPSETAFVFPSTSGGQLSESSFKSVLKRLGRGDVTAHGFRSSFRTWASEQTAFPYEVIELSLAHKVGGSVERSYQRGTLLQRRRELLDQWAAYLAPQSMR